ncbi:MAG: penicillin-binding protein activator [Pseudomonadota bacterium]
MSCRSQIANARLKGGPARLPTTALGILMLVLAACSSNTADRVVVAPTEQPKEAQIPADDDADEARGERRRYDPGQFIDPLHMRGREPVRVALLLPFSSNNESARRVATSMFEAAQLAAFGAADDRFLLLPKDTKGTPDGASAAARAALADGAELLLGPVYGSSVEPVARVATAANVPVIAFTSDTDRLGNGVYALSFPPEEEIQRITEFALQTGRDKFGLISPGNRFGQRVATSFREEVAASGGTLVHEEIYEQDVEAMRAPARRLAQYSTKATVEPTDSPRPEDRYRFQPQPYGGDGGYQAVLVPERGTLLRALAPLFPYYNVNIDAVKLLGISAWNDPRLMREPALRGAWFAGPDPEVSAAFKKAFEDMFGKAPPRLASLSYDATLLAARLARSVGRRRRFEREAITDPNGYFGADGLFRLLPDGSVERGLAVMEINSTEIKVIDPAPRSFAPAF